MLCQLIFLLLGQTVEQECVNCTRLCGTLVHRLHCVESFVIDIVLDHRFDQVCNVLVAAHIAPDPGGTHIFKISRQLQAQNFSLQLLTCCDLLGPCAFGVARKQDMREGVDGVLTRCGPVGRGMFHDIASCHDIDFLAREAAAQPGQIIRARDVDRDLDRKQEDTVEICDRHHHDLPADLVRLGIFGPGELVNRQIDMEAHRCDLTDNRFMAERKRIKGSGEEGNPGTFPESDPLMVLQVVRDEPVYMVEGSCIVVPQRDLLIPQNEGQDFAGHGGEVFFLLIQCQMSASEQTGSEEIEGFPRDFHIVMHSSGAEHSLQSFQLFPFDAASGQILQDDADRLQSQDHDSRIAAGVQVMQLPQQRLALIRCHDHIDTPHELRDVFGNGIAAHGEGTHKLQYDLVAL